MSAGWGHALAAAVGGFMKGRNMAQDWQDAEEEKAFRTEQRDVWRKEQSDKQAERSMLQNAAKPIEMQEWSGGEKAVAAMNGSTMGPPAEAPAERLDFNAPMSYRVGTQTFSDQAEAQKAAASMNTPEAQSGRMAQGYRSLGMPDKAIALENSDRQAQIAKMQLADAKFRNELGTAMAGGPEAIADLITKNGGAQLGGATVKAIQEADGTVSFVKVDGEGNQTPYMGATNLPANQAAIKMALAIDKLVTPQQRVEMFTKQEEAKQRQSNADRDYDLKKKEVDSKGDLRVAQIENMMLRAQNAIARSVGTGGGRGGSSGGGGGSRGEQGNAASFDPLYDFDPKQARNAAMNQAIEEAKNTPNKDGTPLSGRQIAARSEEIYSQLRDAAAEGNASRQRAMVFASEARKAKTPEEIEAVRERAAQSGYTNEEMARLDSRFAPAKPKTSANETKGKSQTGKSKDSSDSSKKAVEYTPPEGSPAAKAAQRRAEIANQRAAEKEANQQMAMAGAREVINSKDMRLADELLRSPGFGYLPMNIKAQVSAIANGRGM